MTDLSETQRSYMRLLAARNRDGVQIPESTAAVLMRLGWIMPKSDDKPSTPVRYVLTAAGWYAARNKL